jgi:branched-chain amino acid transport system ATP-binding protein
LGRPFQLCALIMLTLDDISKYFGGLAALNEVCLKVKEGEFLGLIGPNGSGKTTLFDVISGVLKPSSGRVSFKGEDITDFYPDKICHLGIARTFQIPRPFKDLSVLENVSLGVLFGNAGQSASYSEQAAKRDAFQYMDFVGLRVDELTMPNELTAVGLRRLELARALATKPTLLLADEVISGLNQEEISEASSVLKRIKDEMGVTIIWVEHIMGALMSLVERVVVLDYGKIIAEGKPSEVSKDKKVIEAYLGEEEPDIL